MHTCCIQSVFLYIERIKRDGYTNGFIGAINESNERQEVEDDRCMFWRFFFERFESERQFNFPHFYSLEIFEPNLAQM